LRPAGGTKKVVHVGAVGKSISVNGGPEGLRRKKGKGPHLRAIVGQHIEKKGKCKEKGPHKKPESIRV